MWTGTAPPRTTPAIVVASPRPSSPGSSTAAGSRVVGRGGATSGRGRARWPCPCRGAVHWPDDLFEAGFVDIETFSFDAVIPSRRDGWRGRVRASAWLGARGSGADTARLDRALTALLDGYDDPLEVPHRIFVVHGRKRSEGA